MIERGPVGDLRTVRGEGYSLDLSCLINVSVTPRDDLLDRFAGRSLQNGYRWPQRRRLRVDQLTRDVRIVAVITHDDGRRAPVPQRFSKFRLSAGEAHDHPCLTQMRLALQAKRSIGGVDHYSG